MGQPCVGPGASLFVLQPWEAGVTPSHDGRKLRHSWEETQEGHAQNWGDCAVL